MDAVPHDIRGPEKRAPPLLLIRPLGGTMALWGLFRDALAEGRRVISFDAPAKTSTRGLAKTATELLDTLAIKRAHVFGLSLGGMIATWMAVDSPGRVARLVLASTSARAASLTRVGLGRGLSFASCFVRSQTEVCLVKRVLSRRFVDERPDDLALLESILRAHPTPRRTLLAHAAAAGGHDATRVLGRITSPTLILAGEEDELLGIEPQLELAADIQGARFAAVPRSGHDLTLEQPRHTAAAVSAFLDAQDR